MRRRLVLLCIASLVLLASCKGGEPFEIWYGTSDRFGFMVAWEKKTSSLVVAAIPLEVVSRYRQDLAVQGVRSDDLGAIANLFGHQASHYLKGDKAAWDALAQVLMDRESIAWQGTRPAFEAMATLVVRHGGYLSKTGAAGTLGTLAGPHTDDEDVRRFLRTVASREPSVTTYDLGRFLSPGIEETHLRQWVRTWTDEALRNAAR